MIHWPRLSELYLIKLGKKEITGLLCAGDNKSILLRETRANKLQWAHCYFVLSFSFVQ